MQTIQANWEDEENNRHIEFSVAFTRQDDAVEVRSITPSKVTFFCPETKNAVRTIRVWTDKGREMLKGQLHSSGELDKDKIEATIDAYLAV